MSRQGKFRIGFWLGDASLSYGGIGPYAWRVLKALLTSAERDAWRFIILCEQDAHAEIAQLVDSARTLAELHILPSPQNPPSDKHERRASTGSLRERLSARFGKAARDANDQHYDDQHYLEKWLGQLDLDLLHFPTQTILHNDLQVPYALTMHGLTELPHARLPVPHIITMHDVQELHFPEYFTAHQRAIRAVHYWKAMEKAARVIVSYEHVKIDLMKFFALPADKIHVCPIPFRAISFREPTPAAAAAYREKYAAWMPFLLYPAQTWRHKNHLRLLQALQNVRDSFGDNLRLICTGGTSSHYHAEVAAQVSAQGLSGAVLFAGVVPEDELTWLYGKAALVVIPTEYEAGSFPLYEAMLLDAPVICSNATSLPETIGDARFVFDARDTKAMADLIYEMLTNESLRDANIANSARQAARLRQIDAAKYFYETYRNALSEPSAVADG